MGNACGTNCSDCIPMGCPAICALPSPLTTTPTTLVWNGADWLGGTCGANVSCERNTCAPAGRYTATMCAYPNPGTGQSGCAMSGTQTPTCKDFAFDWPPATGSAVVSWVIGGGSGVDAGAPTDAGSCFTSSIPASYKNCYSNTDCIVKAHQTDCCGSRHYEGISSSLSSLYDSCESAWDSHFPACGCFVQGGATADDGQVVTDPSTVGAYCVSPLGGVAKQCVTAVKTNDAGGKGVCASSADCPPSMVCGFSESSACSDVGTCFPAPAVTCNAYSPGCACDGTTINVVCNGLPNGYEPKPLRHTGTCVDGG
jgi:hypothetical protein